MSEEEDILIKMDALLKRHQPAAPAGSNVPTLTEVVTPPQIETAPIPVLTEIVDQPPLAQECAPTPHTVAAEPLAAPSNQPMSPEDMELVISSLVNDWLDRNISAKLDKLDAYAEELVRETVAAELQKHMDSLAADLAKRVRAEIRAASASTLPDRGE